ncbi:MBL fold metallo-hydrolase [Streptomyces sp. NPDC048611]|uniref:MBL fold metallo-hydrolase n=1 Tax=Streptomyces sp. NPDC048611 TaxID=3155635 RepID=UPI0034208414
MTATPHSSRPVALRPDVVAEPLIDHWYAWSHLLSPGTAARNIARRQLPIMTSYLASPAVHQRSSRTPALAGGPFMDLGDGDRSADIEALIETTRRRAARLLEFDGAVDELQELLAKAGPGAPLEGLYPLVPEPLKGYVELVYDLQDNASFRLIEALLYRSDYASTDGQALALEPLRADRRPFALSTPRLDTDERTVLPVPFHHPGVDVMFSTLRTPRPFGEVAEALELTPDAAARLARYFTEAEAETPATAARREPVREPRIRYLGHACVLAENDRGAVLVDPLLPPAFPGAGPRLTDSDLPDYIDHVLITHGHQDHLVLESLLRLRTRIGTIVVPRADAGSLQDPSLRLALEAAGFPRVIELGELQQTDTAMGRITAVPFFGEHGDLAIAKSAWLLESDGRSVLFAADTATVDPDAYAHVRRAIGEVDVLFLGMECEGAPLTWLYGPLFTQEPAREMAVRRRLNGNDDLGAMALAEALGCGRAYVYAMGHEPWVWYLTTTTFDENAVPVQAAERFVAACRARGIEAQRLHGSCDLPW